MARSAAYLELCNELGLKDLHEVTVSMEHLGLHTYLEVTHPNGTPITIIDEERIRRISNLAGSISRNDFPTDEDLAEEALWNQ